MASEPSAEQLNTITWTEIPCTDLTRVQTFYNTVFGWNVTPFPAQDADTANEPCVAMFNKGAMHGCFVKLAPENLLSPATHPDNEKKERASVRVTITVGSVDEMLEKVKEAGGDIYSPKHEIPGGMGFLTYFTDTEQNVMGLWSAK